MGEGGQTHYEVLGIGRYATAELVRQAYRRQAQKYHPDRQAGSEEAQRDMARINEAYAVLSDPCGREAYDRWFDAREDLLAAERAVAQAAHATRFSASWPWLLLAATLAFILASVGTVLYKEFVPVIAPVASIVLAPRFSAQSRAVAPGAALAIPTSAPTEAPAAAGQVTTTRSPTA